MLLRRGIPSLGRCWRRLTPAEGAGLCALGGDCPSRASSGGIQSLPKVQGCAPLAGDTAVGWSGMTLMPASIARVHDTPAVFVVRGTRSPPATNPVGLFMAETLEFQVRRSVKDTH